MTRYWIGVASKNHVARGKAGGFAQLCHGKISPLARLTTGDYFVYYSPKLTMEGSDVCQNFTALGVVGPEPIQQVEMAPGIRPFRRSIRYFESVDASVRPLIPLLSCIRNKSKWGAAFRFGLLEVPKSDFLLIAEAMKVDINS